MRECAIACIFSRLLSSKLAFCCSNMPTQIKKQLNTMAEQLGMLYMYVLEDFVCTCTVSIAIIHVVTWNLMLLESWQLASSIYTPTSEIGNPGLSNHDDSTVSAIDKLCCSK